MAIDYEWVIEELEGPDTGDDVEILDVNHADTYAGAQALAADLTHYRIGLVRDDDEGRSWAYIVKGKLGADMLDAYGHRICGTPREFSLQFLRAVVR